MNINYYLNESKIHDLLQFPRLLFVQHAESTSEGYGYTALDLKNLDDQKYIEFIKAAQKKLVSFSEEIKPFYANEFMCDYDFFNILTRIFPIGGCATLDAYLSDLIKKENKYIKIEIITSLLIIESEDNYDKLQSTRDKAQNLFENPTKLMAFIKDLATEENYKWHLMMMLDNPVKSLEKYKALMQRIQPVFNSFYLKHEDKITAVSKQLLDTFNTNDLKTINTLTQNMIDHKLILSKANKLLISFVFPYAFIIKTDPQTSYIIWGLKMEDGFKKISKNYHDELNNRAQVFKNLGDLTRYEVLKLIASGTTSTKDIAQKLNVSSATISYHINAFITSRVITLSKTKGKKYDLNIKLLESVFDACLNDLKQQ